MSKKKRRGRRHRTHVSDAPLSVRETALPATELTRTYEKAIGRSPPARGGELAERHRLALADVKRSMVIGSVMFVLLIAFYLLMG